MIVLPGRHIAIMTPPKCGTNTLHTALRQPPFNGESYCGASPLSLYASDSLPVGLAKNFSRHINYWPSEVRGFRKLAVVRKPDTRLVSMYLHLCSRLSAVGSEAPSFSEYVETVADGRETRTLYSWNLSRWLEGVEADGWLRLESLQEDLLAEGVDVKTMMPINVSVRAQPYADFYTDKLRAMIEAWAAPDRERWYSDGGYAGEVSAP